MDIYVPFDRLGDAVQDDIEKSIRKLIISIFSQVDVASPIGRPELWETPASPEYRPGWFKANWRVVFGNPPEQPLEKDARGKGDIAHGYKYEFGMVTHILNNTPYAQRLAEGWSTQAPIGWVETAIKAGIRYGTR